MKKSNEENREIVYEVYIARNDQQMPMIVCQSVNYEECFEKWEELQELWQISSNENKAFVMKEPLVTAFNPVLIREITLRPVVEQSVGKYKNPYQREMIEKGFSEAFGKPGHDFLDGGYK